MSGGPATLTARFLGKILQQSGVSLAHLSPDIFISVTNFRRLFLATLSGAAMEGHLCQCPHQFHKSRVQFPISVSRCICCICFPDMGRVYR
ncbi:hypothetical protein E2C01_026313 [Portunus trituberculatus]|uniref:Uncharacterized protein n=1 Tax=Portunus trituberculatus TaxID=210409 RepID=A0A5B7EHU5_PORTR|nr:hypothetical protein [Portunus trituberculatus]